MLCLPYPTQLPFQSNLPFYYQFIRPNRGSATELHTRKWYRSSVWDVESGRSRGCDRAHDNSVLWHDMRRWGGGWRCLTACVSRTTPWHWRATLRELPGTIARDLGALHEEKRGIERDIYRRHFTMPSCLSMQHLETPEWRPGYYDQQRNVRDLLNANRWKSVTDLCPAYLCLWLKHLRTDIQLMYYDPKFMTRDR
jgi:hypothetical protein